MKKNVEPDDSIFEGCEQVGSDPPAYRTTHYIVEADPKYIRKALSWAKYIESHVYPTMIKMMGHKPTHNLHILHFTDAFLGRKVIGTFRKFEYFRGFYGSQIHIIQKKLDKMRSYQKEGGITHETIHALLEEAKNERAKWSPIWKPELLDRIFEMELSNRLGDHEVRDSFYKKCLKKGDNYAVFAQFWNEYGWNPFKSIIVRLHNEPDSCPIFDQSKFVHYMSSCYGEDVSIFFEKQGCNIDKKTKEKIKEDLQQKE